MATSFNSFAALAKNLNIRIKNKRETIKCENCGGPLRQIKGSNIWICDYSKLEEKTTKDGKPVQVFTPCNRYILTSI